MQKTLLDTFGNARMHRNILDLGFGKQILTCLLVKFQAGMAAIQRGKEF